MKRLFSVLVILSVSAFTVGCGGPDLPSDPNDESIGPGGPESEMSATDTAEAEPGEDESTE
jgi:hypothetical protein